MGAYVYIHKPGLPGAVSQTAVRRADGKQHWISFPDCPFAGIEEEYEIYFPYPRNLEMRAQLVAWLDYWNLSYGVER
ncbi:gp65 [Caballeronia pedi]|uniref:Gp65 n=1 Tax=Caballeronia pedi TaxID=1777141 RepID=A0A158BHR9_9BURK|nr:gp65 [Caballeronia pedi]